MSKFYFLVRSGQEIIEFLRVFLAKREEIESTIRISEISEISGIFCPENIEQSSMYNRACMFSFFFLSFWLLS